MRIGLSSIIGDGFGSGSFSFGEVPSGGSFPPYGTFYETLVGVEYPIAEGGDFIEGVPNVGDVPNQVCDVDVYHNGSGGFYNDWANATNIAYKPAGTLIWQDTNIVTGNPQEVPEGSGNYYDAYWVYPNYKHDGTGNYVYDDAVDNFWADGVEVSDALRSYYQTVVPSGSDTSFNNGKYETYVWDGVGGFYLSTNLGSFLPNGTLITDVLQTVEVPTGSEMYYANGKYTRYNWNGTGGYTTLTNQGSFYANGTVITSGDNETLEVPNSSGNYFSTGRYANYVWNGSGSYTTTFPNGSYDEYGTFITSDESYNYYWNGSGGYYTESL